MRQYDISTFLTLPAAATASR